MREEGQRFEQLLPADRAMMYNVAIYGCGAVGSWAAVIFAKFGIRRFFLADYDQVLPVNRGVQAFGDHHLDMRKVDAVEDLIRTNGRDDVEICTYPHEIKRGWWPPVEYNIHVIAFDRMAPRRHVYNGLRNTTNGNAWILIDPRMDATSFEVHAVLSQFTSGYAKGQNREYEKTLHLGDEDVPMRCGEHAMPQTALACATKVTETARKYMMGERFLMYESHDMILSTTTRGHESHEPIKPLKRKLVKKREAASG